MEWVVDATPWPLALLGMIRCPLYWKLGGSQGVTMVWGSHIVVVEVTVLLSIITTWLTRELVIWEAPMRTLCVLLCENLTSSFTMLWGKNLWSFSSRLVKTTMDSTAAARVQGKQVILGTNYSAQVNILCIGFLLITTSKIYIGNKAF